MILLLDAGNTRIKWRIDNADGSTGWRGGWRWSECHDLPAPEELGNEVMVLRAAGVCVAGESRREELAALVLRHFGVALELVVSARRQAGLINSYDDVLRMGADRWVAMIGAYHAANRSAVVVVDAGTAITVDGVGADGQHLGGYIMPGLEMLRRVLLGGTGEIRVRHDSKDLAPGVGTEAAVGNGCMLMAVAAIEQAVTRFACERVMLTGGDAPELNSLLSVPVEAFPELVLDGLVISCGQRPLRS